jgi:hypothetical protein
VKRETNNDGYSFVYPLFRLQLLSVVLAVYLHQCLFEEDEMTLKLRGYTPPSVTEVEVEEEEEEEELLLEE